jgi:hypothetical protein
LIVAESSSHATPKYGQYYMKNNIIILCMPADMSYLLQPLDMSCYSPPKSVHGYEIRELARQGVFHINKIEFLHLHPRVRKRIFLLSNIQSGFQATGLIPYQPARVLGSLAVIRTPSPPRTVVGDQALWTAETPHTIDHLEYQAKLVQNLINRQFQSSETATWLDCCLFESKTYLCRLSNYFVGLAADFERQNGLLVDNCVSQLLKGCELAMNSTLTLAEENTKLWASNERRKQRRNIPRQ